MYLSCIAIVTHSGNNREQISKQKQEEWIFLHPSGSVTNYRCQGWAKLISILTKQCVDAYSIHLVLVQVNVLSAVLLVSWNQRCEFLQSNHKDLPTTLRQEPTLSPHLYTNSLCASFLTDKT